MESSSYFRNRSSGRRRRALSRRRFYVSLVCGPRRAGDRPLIGQRLRADGRRGRAPGSAAARKPADRHMHSGGHDLCRRGHGRAAGPGHQPASPSFVLRDRRWRRHRNRRHAGQRDTHFRSDCSGARRKHDHRQRNERLRAGTGALSSGCAGARWPDRSGPVARCRSGNDGCALCSKRRLRQPAASS
jgi:hypothetical protein